MKFPAVLFLISTVSAGGVVFSILKYTGRDDSQHAVGGGNIANSMTQHDQKNLFKRAGIAKKKRHRLLEIQSNR